MNKFEREINALNKIELRSDFLSIKVFFARRTYVGKRTNQS